MLYMFIIFLKEKRVNMKSIILTSVLCSGVSQAMPVKVFDGSVVTCKSKADLHRTKLQAYKVKSFNAEQFGDYVEVTLNIQMLECTQANKDFAFKEKNIFDLFSYKNAKNENIEVRTKSANVIFYQDGVYKSLSKVEVNDGHDMSKIKAVFNVRDILTKDELELYELGVGVKLNTSLDFNLNRRVEISNSEFSDEFNQSYGGFRIQLEIQ